MDNKIIGVTLAVFVSIILVGGLMVPIVNDATSPTDTFTNQGIFYVNDLPAGSTLNYIWNNGELTVNGEVIDIAAFESAYDGSSSIMFTENMTVRYATGESVIAFKGAVFCNNIPTANIIVSDGTITGTYMDSGTEKTLNVTYTEFTGIVPKSSMIMANAPVYLATDSEIHVTGFVNASGLDQYYVVNVTGSIGDGITVSVYDQLNGTAVDSITVSNIEIDADLVDGYTNLYVFNKISFIMSNDTATHDVTFSLMVVPEKISAELTDPMDPAAAGILNVAPILVIVALLTMAVALFVRSKF